MTEISDWQRAEYRPGMVHFPTEANRDTKRYCSGCAHGKPVGKPKEHGFEARVRCAKMVAHLKSIGIKGKPASIKAAAPGCKYWEKRP